MKEERKQLDQISEYLEKVGSSENKLEDSALFFEYLDYDFSLISMGEIMTLSVLNSCKCNENGYLKESVLDEVGALVSLFIEEKPLCSYDLHKPRYDEICRYGELGKRFFSTIEWCKEEARIETLKNLTYPYLGGVGISNLVVLKELSKDKVRVKN